MTPPASLAELKNQFQHPDITFREGPGGLVMIQVENEFSRAELSLYGGHVLSFQPVGKQPVLWMSPDAIFEKGTAIRGGVPVCWPWFGPDPTGAGRPSHGFARTSDWTLRSINRVENGTELVLLLTDSPRTLALWPHRFELTLTVTIGSQLSLRLTTRNLGTEPLELTQALHTYFAVDDIRDVSVLGLEGVRFFDRLDGTSKLQSGPIRFASETDRDYVDTDGDCAIKEEKSGRRIRVARSGSRSTVVWNPWSDKAQRLADFPDEAFTQMLCVETANTTELDTIQLAPGASHELGTCLSVLMDDGRPNTKR